jgi:hypothetical protein
MCRRIVKDRNSLFVDVADMDDLSLVNNSYCRKLRAVRILQSYSVVSPEVPHGCFRAALGDFKYIANPKLRRPIYPACTSVVAVSSDCWHAVYTQQTVTLLHHGSSHASWKE